MIKSDAEDAGNRGGYNAAGKNRGMYQHASVGQQCLLFCIVAICDRVRDSQVLYRRELWELAASSSCPAIKLTRRSACLIGS